MKEIELKEQEDSYNMIGLWESALYQDVLGNLNTRYNNYYEEHWRLLKSNERQIKIIFKLHPRYDLLWYQSRYRWLYHPEYRWHILINGYLSSGTLLTIQTDFIKERYEKLEL